MYRSRLVAEGGGFCSDGEGTVITAETCILNPNRNPGMTKSEAEAELRAMLGARKVMWLPGDVTQTETDGHVGAAAFTALRSRSRSATAGARRGNPARAIAHCGRIVPTPTIPVAVLAS